MEDMTEVAYEPEEVETEDGEPSFTAVAGFGVGTLVGAAAVVGYRKVRDRFGNPVSTLKTRRADKIVAAGQKIVDERKVAEAEAKKK